MATRKTGDKVVYKNKPYRVVSFIGDWAVIKNKFNDTRRVKQINLSDYNFREFALPAQSKKTSKLFK